MHISSLPGDFEVGTMGKEAREFIDLIGDMGFTYWQVLPLNPTVSGGSPYSGMSLFAGNPSFIDPSLLVDEGLLTAAEVNDVRLGSEMVSDLPPPDIKRLILYKKAFQRLDGAAMKELRAFAEKNKHWIYDYALFMIIRNEFDGVRWSKWPAIGLRLHKEDAVRDKLSEKENEMMFWVFIQHVFYKQLAALRKYANDRGVYIIGDMPIYASYDSSDVWANSHLYELNSKFAPKRVSGVPPDYFNKNGQLWCNPLYEWDTMKEDGYAWWMKRFEQALDIYDAIRIDHFRGFYSYWAVPNQNRTAKRGAWAKGPGTKLFTKVKRKFNDAFIIAEDLGDLDKATLDFYKKVGYPGMRVLQFGFENERDATHRPDNIIENCLAYTGTHDNNTIVGWYDTVSDEGKSLALKYCKYTPPEQGGAAIDMCMAWIETLFKTNAAIAIVPIQDMLALGAEARMNTPGTPAEAGNWAFRLTKDMIGQLDRNRLLQLNKKTKRAATASGKK
jgi:4-alpha-glucanotransferase